MILQGDCREVLATLEDESVDSCVTDPPYDLTAGKKGGSGAASLNVNSPAGRSRIGTGGGLAWDATGVAFQPETWAAVLRVLKPGAHLLAFGGTRTHHRMVCAIEDAGFEIRDEIQWLYSTGFPKSLDVSKAIDKAEDYKLQATIRRAAVEAVAARRWEGWGTALKPACEPICVARKPLVGTVAANVLAHGTGALNIDGCRIGLYGAGRWPANVILDPEAAALLDEQCGGTSRFFYVAKPAQNERHAGGEVENTHPTVKPVELIRYLIRLVTPPGGVVLDPFGGSGTTAIAAHEEGFRSVLIELSPEYVEIARRRVAAATAQGVLPLGAA